MTNVFRSLNPEELEYVSGGSDSITVVGRPYHTNLASYGTNWRRGDASAKEEAEREMISDLDNWSNSDDDGDGVLNGVDQIEIVVTATPMTNEQKNSYDAALLRANAEVSALSVFGVGATALLAEIGAGAAVATAVAGYAAGRVVNPDSLVKHMAATYYKADGADGRWDGLIGDGSGNFVP